MEIPADEIPIGLVGTDEPGLVILYFDHAHRERIKEILEGTVVFIRRDHLKVIQIQPSDFFKVSGFLRILKPDLDAFLVPVPDFFFRDGLAVVITLQLGTSDFLQELYLRKGFYAFTDGVDSKCLGHLDQLSENDLAVISLFQLAHETHIEFD